MHRRPRVRRFNPPSDLIRDLGATVLACTPSYALHLYEVGLENGIDFKKLPLRVGIFGGEPWSKAMRQEMEENMGIDTHNIYGLSEIMGPGVAIDCSEHNGLHLWEDHFIAEIVDPATGEPVPEGELGELVLTNLTKEGSPLIRYRTRDLTSIDTRPCKCGRTHARLQRFAGRSDDMLIIRGVNVFPQQIEGILMESEGLTPNYQIIVDRVNNSDTLEVMVEMTRVSMSSTPPLARSSFCSFCRAPHSLLVASVGPARKLSSPSLVAIHANENVASSAVLQKAGFVYDHDVIDHKFDGTAVPCRAYHLVKEDL